MTADTARRLTAALLLQAIRDAQAEDPHVATDARRWLAGEGAAWAEWLDLDPERVAAWVGDLPPLAQLSLW